MWETDCPKTRDKSIWSHNMRKNMLVKELKNLICVKGTNYLLSLEHIGAM